MKLKFLKNNKLALLGIIIGGILGYLYYYYIGCISGHCIITSSPVNSTLYGIIIGGLFLSIFENKK